MRTFKWTGERVQLFDELSRSGDGLTYTQVVRIFHWKFAMHSLRALCAFGYAKLSGDRYIVTCLGITARTMQQYEHKHS